MFMKIALLGATGQLGKHLLQKLVIRGHEVRSLVRSPIALSVEHSSMTVVQGDALDAAAVAEVLVGAEAVINAIGGEGDIRSAAIGHVIAAMQAAGMRRLINLGGAGILQIGPVLLYKLPIFPKPLVPVTKEHYKVYEALKVSDLDWTMVCPPFMTRGPGGEYRVKADRPFLKGSREVPIAAVADFIIEELNNPRFIGKRVAISRA